MEQFIKLGKKFGIECKFVGDEKEALKIKDNKALVDMKWKLNERLKERKARLPILSFSLSCLCLYTSKSITFSIFFLYHGSIFSSMTVPQRFVSALLSFCLLTRSLCLSVCLSVCLSICLSICLSVSVCLSLSPSLCLCLLLSVSLSLSLCLFLSQMAISHTIFVSS